MKKPAILAGGALAMATALLVLWIQVKGKGTPGFFGPGVLSADVNLVLEFLFVLGLITYYFWYAA